MKFTALFFLVFSAQAMASYCLSDKKKFCSHIETGRGQIAKCLSDYEDKLTPGCKKELYDFRKNSAKKNPCFEDLADFCTDIPNEIPKLELCLLKNENRLGGVCSQDFKKRKAALLKKNECATDVVNHCYADVAGVEGSVMRCLMRTRAKLTPACKSKIDVRMTKLRKENPCFDDQDKHCPTQVRFADIQDCLEKKLKVVAPQCKTIVEREMAKEKANPCYKDLTRHCVPNLAPKEQHECLTLNEEHLSNACRQYRVNEKDKIKKLETQCEADRVKLCKDAPFKDGLVLKCLRSKKAQLSPGCKALM